MNIIEYPISVVPYVRTPFFISALFSMGLLNVKTMFLYNMYYDYFRRTSNYINLEFHAIELSDMEKDNISTVMKNQPSMRINHEKKYDMFKKILMKIRKDFQLSVLRECEDKDSRGYI